MLTGNSDLKGCKGETSLMSEVASEHQQAT